MDLDNSLLHTTQNTVLNAIKSEGTFHTLPDVQIDLQEMNECLRIMDYGDSSIMEEKYKPPK